MEFQKSDPVTGPYSRFNHTQKLKENLRIIARRKYPKLTQKPLFKVEHPPISTVKQAYFDFLRKHESRNEKGIESRSVSNLQEYIPRSILI
jgi:hypothetical protein